jgi:hypothetical protein
MGPPLQETAATADARGASTERPSAERAGLEDKQAC